MSNQITSKNDLITAIVFLPACIYVFIVAKVGYVMYIGVIPKFTLNIYLSIFFRASSIIMAYLCIVTVSGFFKKK